MFVFLFFLEYDGVSSLLVKGLNVVDRYTYVYVTV